MAKLGLDQHSSEHFIATNHQLFWGMTSFEYPNFANAKRCTQPIIDISYSMKILGHINDRQILYCNIRVDSNWFSKLPTNNWIAFTIADNEDKDLLDDTTIKCLDNGVCYTCSAGQLGSATEDYFDQEIAWRETQKEEATGEPADFDKTAMTTFHKNFGAGFWFATTVAYATINDKYLDTDKVVCIDFTTQRVENHIINLIDKINNGWLPSDEEIEVPMYDTQI